MKTPKRIKASGLSNLLDFELTIDRISQIQTEVRALSAERDAAVQAAQQLNAIAIAELEAEQKAKAALCEKYADEHRAELLPDKAVKSAETPLSRWGFRLGNRSVLLLRKTLPWDEVVGLLKLVGAQKCIRTVEEVNKEAILSSTNAMGELTHELGTCQIGDVGLKIKQDETFYIEPKVDGGEQVKP